MHRTEPGMDLLNDLRYTLRSLRRSPGFTAVAVASVALGIGANAAIFSIVNGVLLRPLDFREPSKLFVVRERVASTAHLYPTSAANLKHYLEWRQRAKSFELIGAGLMFTANLSGIGESERLGGMRISANFFDVLGTRPTSGRWFDSFEEHPGNDKVVAISDALWTRKFARDPTVLGRTLVLDAVPHTIVGIVPADFGLTDARHLGGTLPPLTRQDVYTPLGLDLGKVGRMGEFDWVVIGRLAPGVSREQAVAELNAIQDGIGRSLSQPVELSAALIPLQEQIVGESRRGLLLLMAAVGSVFLIVCVNLANLMLVRATARSREHAIRKALGAGRRQLMRLMLLEALVICSVGCAVGLILAIWAVDLFVANAPAALPQVDVGVDWEAALFACGLAALAALLFGAVPAWRAAWTDPQDALRAGSHTLTDSRSWRRTRSTLVAAEVAMSAALLVVAGLLAASLVRLLTIDKGFETSHVTAAEIALRADKPPAERGRIAEALLEKARSLPGVEAAGLSTVLPMEGAAHVSFVAKEGDTRGVFELPVVNYRYVSPNYGSILRIPLKQGRWFDESDRSREAVVLSERVARELWPEQNPLGRKVRPGGSSLPWAEVIGVVADTRSVRLDRNPPLMIYVPWWKRNPAYFSILLRSASDTVALAGALRHELAAIDPEAVVSRARTLDRVRSDALAARRFQLWLIVAFAASALVLASLGIYGVVAYTVTRRRAELGIRLALGSTTGEMMWLVLRQGMRPVLVGLIAGLALALATSRLLSALLFQVPAADPTTYAGVAGVLLGVSALACYVPARRASRIDPVHALRYE